MAIFFFKVKFPPYSQGYSKIQKNSYKQTMSNVYIIFLISPL